MTAFRMTNREGDELGEIRIAAIAWSPGDLIPRDRGEVLKVLEVHAPTQTDEKGTLVVEPE
jgi:hypothetical protein